LKTIKNSSITNKLLLTITCKRAINQFLKDETLKLDTEDKFEDLETQEKLINIAIGMYEKLFKQNDSLEDSVLPFTAEIPLLFSRLCNKINKKIIQSDSKSLKKNNNNLKEFNKMIENLAKKEAKEIKEKKTDDFQAAKDKLNQYSIGIDAAKKSKDKKLLIMSYRNIIPELLKECVFFNFITVTKEKPEHTENQIKLINHAISILKKIDKKDRSNKYIQPLLSKFCEKIKPAHCSTELKKLEEFKNSLTTL
jgi:activator of 2-hydroxyglutaryl-CoA dehydratase